MGEFKLTITDKPEGNGVDCSFEFDPPITEDPDSEFANSTAVWAGVQVFEFVSKKLAGGQGMQDEEAILEKED